MLVFVYLLSIEIQTAVWIWMKFGTEVVLEGEGSWGSFNPPPGSVVHKGGLGCLWSLSHAFWQKLY